MDISKIIANARDKSLKEAAQGKYDSLDDQQQQYTLLMNYSDMLLKTYHEELKNELSKHGLEL